MKMNIKIAAASVLMACLSPAIAGEVDPARVEAVVQASFGELTPELQALIDQDETMKECSLHRDLPPSEVADAIIARETASIVYPADGVLMGDWKVAIKESNNGFGWRLGDDPAKTVGGNCTACHQLVSTEVAYGNLGPSLMGYGQGQTVDDELIKATYNKIYNSQSVLACSQMPRFGATGFLTPEQIRDYVAMLLSPESPVNQ